MALLAVLIFKAVSAGGKQEAETVKAIEIISSGQQEETEDQKEEEMLLYGCELYGTYEYPFNTMSQDWGTDDIEGFYYHEIPKEAAAAGGTMPVVMQAYTYIVCKNYGVDYEIVLALIEKESMFRWDAIGDNGKCYGYMQIQKKYHEERMQRLHCTDLLDPFQNVMVGVDYLAELKEQTGNTTDMLAAYNYGLQGARSNLWAYGVHEYSYNKEIMARADQLKEETAAGRAVTEQCSSEN